MGLWITACSQEELIESTDDSALKSECELIVKYAGKTYFTGVAFQNDSTIYLNKEYATLYENEISKNKKLAILFHEDDLGRDVVEYYESPEVLEKENNISYMENQKCVELKEEELLESTRGSNTVHYVPFAGTALGRAQLWDDKDYSDRSVVLQCSETHYQSIPSLKAFADFNDKTSSIKVWNYMNLYQEYSPYNNSIFGIIGAALRTCLISYEDINFQGSVLYCISNATGNPNPHEDRRLKSIGWNDKISSVVFTIIRGDGIGKYYFPH